MTRDDIGSDIAGTRWGRRRVPGVDRAAPTRAAGALLPDVGVFQDAEDAVQDALLSAWQGMAGFQGRASIRTWLYRIATNRCLNALRSASRRPVKEWDIAALDLPEPTGLGEIVWLEPYPDSLLEGSVAAPLGPEARYEQTEAISLAFMTALQVLPARQRAVLILREVLRYRASEVADMLGSTVHSVNSSLKQRAPVWNTGWRLAITSRHLLLTPLTNRHWWRSSSAPTSPAMSTPSSSCSPPMSGCPCHRFPSNITVATSWPASTPTSCPGALITSCRRGPTVRWRSAPT